MTVDLHQNKLYKYLHQYAPCLVQRFASGTVWICCRPVAYQPAYKNPAGKTHKHTFQKLKYIRPKKQI